MSERGFQILYEHGPCLVVLKPSGLPTQAPPGIDSLEVCIKDCLRERAGSTGKVYLGIPHRLDRAASGVMVFAADRRAARNLSKQFERRRVKKIYWAAVQGHVAPLAGTWTDTLWKVYGQPRSQVVEASHPGGQSAVLHYRVIGQHRLGSLLEIELETGRTHQIRIQAASRGHAVLGDAHYGSMASFGSKYEDERLRAIALHARSLSFTDPTNKQPVTITAPLPDAWKELELNVPSG